MKEDGDLFNSNDHHGFTIEKGATCADAKAAHQLVVMKIHQCHHEILPSIGELVVLLRWMLCAISEHKHYLGKHHRHERPQHDFPVSIDPAPKICILYM